MTRARLLSLCALALALALLSGTRIAHAVDPNQLADPKLEARYQTLIHQLRCVQCQNETLADSEVEVAGELRAEIRGMLLAGKTDDQIRDYLVSRYTEFILFKPEYSARNAWLWLSPLVLLGIGVIVALRVIRARAALVAGDDEPLEDELAAVPPPEQAAGGAPQASGRESARHA
ncbi:MAG TPA: cytochrome c-type biogenesis protein [Steroidobacteraceae bacterium]|nr:cytochrome c-type biogenesis protein [Steroidobacteraceae bacterium]